MHAPLPLVTAFDWALRGATAALLLAMAVLLLRDHAASLRARIAAAFAIGTAAYAIYFGPGFAQPGASWQLPIFALSAGNIVVLWLFASAVFDDDFRLHPGHFVLWAALAVAAVVTGLAAGRAPAVAQGCGFVLDVAGVVFGLLAMGRALWSWRADLVEGRRTLRFVMVVGGAIYGIAATWARFGTRPGSVGGWTSLIDIAALAVLATFVAFRLLQITPKTELALTVPDGTGLAATPSTPGAPAAAEAPRRTAAEQALIDRVVAEMTVERAYRRENLTIGALAAHLHLQEYRLRRLINQGLGYRNFNAFLNHYRIEAAKLVLADPARADVPVLTIAVEVGFQSIGPFNRAFKAATGLTPSEFRRSPPAAGAPTPPTLADSEIAG